MENNEEKLEPQQTEALVKQNALPALDVVKNRDGSDRVVARQKGKFTKTANARVLATQKVIENIMHKPDEDSTTQLEKIITSQAKVCEENTDARNLGGISKFLEHVDEISGSKAAREALTREINAPVVPTVIYISVPEGIKMMEERPPEKTQPSFAEVTSVTTNPAPTPTGCNSWTGRNRRHNKPVVLTNDRRETQQ